MYDYCIGSISTVYSTLCHFYLCLFPFSISPSNCLLISSNQQLAAKKEHLDAKIQQIAAMDGVAVDGDASGAQMMDMEEAQVHRVEEQKQTNKQTNI